MEAGAVHILSHLRIFENRQRPASFPAPGLPLPSLKREQPQPLGSDSPRQDWDRVTEMGLEFRAENKGDQGARGAPWGFGNLSPFPSR